MTSFLPSTGRSLDCLLLKPSLMSQSLSSKVIDVRLKHHGSTESADPLLGMVKLTLVKVFLQTTSIFGMPIALSFARLILWPCQSVGRLPTKDHKVSMGAILQESCIHRSIRLFIFPQ